MRRFILFLTLILLIGSACTTTKQDTMPDVGVPNDELNTIIQLDAPPGANSFKIGEWVNVAVKIVDNNSVWFPKDDGARIFVYKDDEWIEVNNLADYSRMGGYILNSYDDDPSNLIMASVIPELTDEDKPVTIRIFVIGNLIEGQLASETKVGAYIDVRLKP